MTRRTAVPLLLSASLAASGCHPGQATPVENLDPKDRDQATARAEGPTPDLRSCGIPPEIREDDWPRRLSLLSKDESPSFSAERASFALLPDTQYYVACENGHFDAQLEFLERSRASRSIAFAAFLGDLTDHNTEREWSFFAHTVHSHPDTPPLLLASGNHDHGSQGSANVRSSLLTRYFPPDFARARAPSVETKSAESLENAYYPLRVGRFRIGVLALEWSPTRDTVRWANEVLARHPEDRVVVTTHAYLYSDDTRYDFATKGRAQKWNPREYPTTIASSDSEGNHDGEMLWSELVRKHANIFLVASGHVLGDGAGRLASRGDAGNTVHQLLSNYQMLDEGGLGFLRLVELEPNGETMHVKTYSPSLGLFSLAPDQNFSLPVEPPLVPVAEAPR